MQEYSVGLLLSDREKTKALSLALRELGMIPHYYENLKEMWTGAMENPRTLVIVDVLCMSQGSLFLKNHPLVKSQSLPLAFYYSSETRPLVHSTYEIFHHGLIEEELRLEGQLKNLLRRVENYFELSSGKEEWQKQARNYSRQIDKAIEANSLKRQRDDLNRVLASWKNQLDQLKGKENFFEAFSQFAERSPEILQYSIVCLDQGKKRLVSPPLSNNKYRRLPPLWAGKVCLDGLDDACQTMASEAAYLIFKGSLMALGIEGMHHGPELMIFVEMESDDYLEEFDWEDFERYLSGIFAFYQWKQAGPHNSEELLNAFDFFSLLETLRSGGEEFLLIDVNFEDLIDLAMARPEESFHFQSFYREFLSYLLERDLGILRIGHMGIEHIGLIVENRESGDVFALIKAHVNRFGHWKYFENLEIALVKGLTPKVQMVPLSATVYLQYLQSGQIHLPRLSQNHRPTSTL